MITDAQQPISVLPRSIGGLSFDAVFEEQHLSELEVTDNPVETGVVISDHAFMKPLKLVITAGVSDTLLRERANDPFAGSENRAREAFRLLSELQAAAEPFSVQTGFKLYENMVCTSIRTLQDKETANVFLFEAQLREVIIVFTQTVTYPKRKSGPTKQQASKRKEKGEQQGSDVDKKNPGSTSVLSKLKGVVGK